MLNRIGRGHFVGRQRELDEALSELQRALTGEGRALVISGEPGIGKTRLAREIMAQMKAAGGAALLGECYAEGDVPYSAITRMIRDSFLLPSGLDLPESALVDLVALAPALRPRFPDLPASPALEPNYEQQRVFESVAIWCAALTARAPLLLFVDDVHWADSGTLLLLRHLARSGRQSRLLVVLTMRDAEPEPASTLNQVLLDLNHERLATHLRLGRLSLSETGDLLAATFTEAIAQDVCEGIYAQTEGNPFFIEEVCKALIEEGKLVYRDGSWQRTNKAEIKLPQTVRAAILARVARVPEPAQGILRLAAVIGREFDLETLRLAGDVDEGTLIAALESALQAQLIAEMAPDGTPALRFVFVHVLIPTALRESTIHVRRRTLHRRVAAALETLRPDDFEALAYHYGEAGDGERAYGYFLLAGKRAQTCSPEDAARLFRAALRSWPTAGMPARAQTLGRLGFCLWVTGDVSAARECFEEAFRLFDELGYRVQAGEVQRMIGRIYWAQADRAAALRHYHQALAILEQEPETVQLARAISAISQMHMLAPEPDEAVAWGERALAMAERLGAEDVIVHAMNNIGNSLGQSSRDWQKGLDLLHASLQRALAINSPSDACRAYYNIAATLQRRCRYAAAAEGFEQLHSYATKVYHRSFVDLALWRLVWVNWDRGRWAAALASHDRLAEFSSDLYATWAARTLAAINIDLGRIEEARRQLEASLPSALQADDLQTTVPHLAELIRAYGALGLADAAMEMVDALIQRLAARPYPFIDCIMPLFFACQYLGGQVATARSEAGATCLAHLERLDSQLQTEESRAALAEARAGLLLAEGRPHAAADHLRQAIADWSTIERRFDQARALGALGQALLPAGDRAEARAAYGEALGILDTLADQLNGHEDLRVSFRASPSFEAMRHRADASGKAVEVGASGRSLAGLTEREIEVLRLVAQGLTNAQIAEHLVLSPLTVNAHLRSIFNKLDVTRRTAAARIAVEHGLV